MMMLLENIPLKQRYLICAVLCVIAIALGFQAFGQSARATSDDLEVTMFDVGQGDSFLLTAPNKNTALIDTGNSNELLVQLGRMHLENRFIDVLVLTHADQDHIGMTKELLQEYHVGQILWTGMACSTNICEQIDDEIERQHISTTIAHAGQIVQLDPINKVHVEILHPEESLEGVELDNKNDGSIVAMARFGESKALFTGDAPINVEKDVLREYGDLHADVLKVGHHGSKTSTSQEFLNEVQPNYALLSVGKNNRYGHPNSEVIERLIARATTIFRTDQQGEIQLCTVGDGQWTTCRK